MKTTDRNPELFYGALALKLDLTPEEDFPVADGVGNTFFIFQKAIGSVGAICCAIDGSGQALVQNSYKMDVQPTQAAYHSILTNQSVSSVPVIINSVDGDLSVFLPKKPNQTEDVLNTKNRDTHNSSTYIAEAKTMSSKNEVEKDMSSPALPPSVVQEILEVDRKIERSYNSTFIVFAALFVIGLVIATGATKIPKGIGGLGVLMGVAGLVGFGLDYKRYKESK